MAKFTVVKEAPSTLNKGEMVIHEPNFLEQVEANRMKAPKHKLTAVNHLREILNSIAEKYDHDMNPLSIKLYNYVGLSFESSEDISKIVVRILKEQYPAAFNKAINFELKNRPLNTKLIYYVGDFHMTSAFYEAGLDYIDQKDLEEFLGGKPKKTVGKPAVTKEQAQQLNENNNDQ